MVHRDDHVTGRELFNRTLADLGFYHRARGETEEWLGFKDGSTLEAAACATRCSSSCIQGFKIVWIIRVWGSPVITCSRPRVPTNSNAIHLISSRSAVQTVFTVEVNGFTN